MTNVILAGTYPAHVLEKFEAQLPKDRFNLRAISDEQEYNAMNDANIIILRIFKAPQAIIEQNPDLKMIMRWGTGFDSVDIKAAGKKGILVTNTPGANAIAVAELAVMMMLAVGRKLKCHMESLKKGIWSKNTFLNSSYTLNQKLVGVIGGGNIGRQVSKRVPAFGATVQYFDTFRLKEEMEKEFNMKYVPLETLLETSDIVTIHVPLMDSTRHMIGAGEIEKMKDGAIIINTARGGLIDDTALAKAVRSGKLSGAGLDGVEREPLSADDELLNDPNIIVTPHVGGGTADLADVIIPMIVQDIQDFSDGKMPNHVVNKEYLSIFSVR